MNSSEKKELSELITNLPPERITCHHRKVYSVKKAKENLKVFCRVEMEREKEESHA
jgi:hypothetical protein